MTHYVKKYGASAENVREKYGDEVLLLAQQYGDDVIKYTLLYGDEGLKIIRKHGKSIILLSSVYGDDVIKLSALHGDDTLKYITKYGSNGMHVIKKYGNEVMYLAQVHGDTVIKYIGMYGDNGLKLASKGKPGLLTMRLILFLEIFSKYTKVIKYGLIAFVLFLFAAHPFVFLSTFIMTLSWFFNVNPIIIITTLGLAGLLFFLRFFKRFKSILNPFFMPFRIFRNLIKTKEHEESRKYKGRK